MAKKQKTFQVGDRVQSIWNFGPQDKFPRLTGVVTETGLGPVPCVRVKWDQEPTWEPRTSQVWEIEMRVP